MSKAAIKEPLMTFSSKISPPLLVSVKIEADRRGLKLYKAWTQMAEEWLKNGRKPK